MKWLGWGGKRGGKHGEGGKNEQVEAKGSAAGKTSKHVKKRTGPKGGPVVGKKADEKGKRLKLCKRSSDEEHAKEKQKKLKGTPQN